VVTGPGPGAVTVRDAQAGDVAVLVGLLVGGSLTVSEDAGDLAPYADALAAITTDPSTTVLVAEVDGQVVGMCQLIVLRHLQHRGGRCAEIESMHVTASHRSGGIGAVLLDAAVERAARAGCYRIQLTSNMARPDAHRFYQRHGFVPSHAGLKRYLTEP
jgi:GNAT superfamily N-acetyltransferase